MVPGVAEFGFGAFGLLLGFVEFGFVGLVFGEFGFVFGFVFGVVVLGFVGFGFSPFELVVFGVPSGLVPFGFVVFGFEIGRAHV